MENNALNINSKSSKTLLFDMDGTLTPARKSITQKMKKVLCNLADSGHTICIVSGSPMSYISEQLDLKKESYPKAMILMPCNGTQVYMQKTSTDQYNKIYGVTMKDILASSSSLPDPHRELVTNILELQLYATRKYKFPVTGNFISDRGSMLNWSMIGRDASHEVREKFTLEENRKQIRKHLCECLRVRLDASDLHTIDLTLGGSTSIDIFPTGWDKTYAIKHLDSREQVWFWGDKCSPQGNDYQIYNMFKTCGRSFFVNNPEDTIKSIQSLVKKGVI